MTEIEIEDDRWLVAVPDLVRRVDTAVTAALKAADAPEGADLVVLLTDNAEMQSLNAEYRDKDKPTNVLSFPAPDLQIPGQPPHLGDMALGYEICAQEATEQGKTLVAHLSHLVVHGTLHLLGYDHLDETEAEAMESLERKILEGLGFPDPYRHDETHAER